MKKRLKYKNNETPTKAICNKGFSGNSGILPRSNFGVGGQESSPQCLTAATLERYRRIFLPGSHPCSDQRISGIENLI